MDEASLLASIETYTGQLLQVETALAAGLDPEQQADLLQLQGDLRQLVELTESSLLSLRKSQLLASLEQDCTQSPQGFAEQSHSVAVEGQSRQSSGTTWDNESASFYAELAGLGGSSPSLDPAAGKAEGEEDGADEEEEEVEPIYSGSKVQAPYRTSWGTLEYHNAMVVGAESPQDGEERVRVLYIHPTNRAMKPCPYYLEDKCRFRENCKFSHGEVVDVAELRDFLEADLSKLMEGSACLARHHDGVFYPAKISDLKDGVYTVKFDSLLLKEAELEADGVIPPMRSDDPASDDLESDEDPDTAFAKVLDGREAGWVAVNSADFGGWEVHTRGIGSRLLMKMGYEQGKGLGKCLEGRVEPVQAMVVPRGKDHSLEGCGELTRALATRSRPTPATDGPPRPRKKLKRREGGGGKPNVFDFLNAKLGPSKASSAPISSVPKDVYRGQKSDKKALNVQLFKATEGVAQAQREIQEIQRSLSRKAGRDPAVISRLEEKLAAAKKRLALLQSQEQVIQTQRKRADTHKNMTEF